MATINAVGTGLVGASGTGSFAGTTSPTFVTPVLGAATATSVAPGNLSLAANTLSSTDTNGDMILSPNGTGSILAKNTTSVSANGVSPAVYQINQTASNDAISIVRFGNFASGSTLTFAHSRGASVGANATLNNNDALGAINFYGNDGASYSIGGQIIFNVDGTPSVGVMPSKFRLFTANTSGVNTVAISVSSAQVVTLANPLTVTSGGTGITSFGTGVATALGQNVTGSGGIALATSPSFVTPVLGVATATSVAAGNLLLSGNTISSTNTNGYLSIIPNGTGQVLFGTSTAITGVGAGFFSATLAQNGSRSFLNIAANINSNVAGKVSFYKSRNTTVGSFTTIVAGDELGTLQFNADDGASYVTSGAIECTSDGAVSAGIIPSMLRFSTTNTSGVLTTALTISNAQALILANALPVTSGGTGLSSTTANQLLYSSATSTIAGLATGNSAVLTTNSSGVPVWSSTLTNGQIIIGSTGATPVAASLTAGSNVTITPGAGTITITASGAGLAWSTLAGTTQSAAVNNGYISGAAAQTTVTLPATAAIGAVVAVEGLGAGGWILAANTGQTIKMGTSTTTSAGSLTSAAASDNVYVVCIVANTTWRVQTTNSTGLTVA